VKAWAMTSRPWRSGGMDPACTGVGVSMFCACRAFRLDGLRPSSEKDDKKRPFVKNVSSRRTVRNGRVPESLWQAVGEGYRSERILKIYRLCKHSSGSAVGPTNEGYPAVKS
jgi:hypothetical protein